MSSKQNQAWQITAPGKLALVDLPVPKPAKNQVLVRIQAVALNYRDIMVVNHDPNYIVKAKPNLVPCCDGAGIVESTGPDSTWKTGDRVFFHPNNWQTGSDPRGFDILQTLGGGSYDGTLQKWVVVNDDRLIKAPDGLSIEEASTIFTAGVTAWTALQKGLIGLRPGMTVLTQGTGGLSCYAIQVRGS